MGSLSALWGDEGAEQYMGDNMPHSIVSGLVTKYLVGFG